ncbi:MAG: ATPase, type [Herminiimonas sp.]|nr:ATPase, type [Herminiimonas sp.]
MNDATPHTATSHGLGAQEAQRRLAEDGRNELPSGPGRNGWRILRDAAREPMFLLLFGAGLLYLALGEALEGIFLFAMVLVSFGLTLYQEGKTEHALEALRDMSNPRSCVIRDGVRQLIDSRDIVRGDIVVLAEGDRVPADAILISGNDLQVDESALTGESVPVRKTPAGADLQAPLSVDTTTVHASSSEATGGTRNTVSGTTENVRPAPGGDDLPFLYSGTLVVLGHGIARVTQTGAGSEIGRIGAALHELAPGPSPLQRQTARLVTTLALLGFGLSVLLVVIDGLIRGDWLQAVLAGIAIAMSMLPAEFPVVLTVFPALGAWRLARAHVLTRRLAAIETLGATSVLCVDKTGTLTQNQMTVAMLHANGATFAVADAPPGTLSEALPEPFHELVEFAILASETTPSDPMEKAFHRLGIHFLGGTEHLHRDWVLVREYALTPALRAMSHAWKSVDRDDYVVAAKGAPEAVVDLCHLDSTAATAALTEADRLAHLGLRVLGVAKATFRGEQWPPSEHDFNFDFVGLIGLADPLRSGIPEAIRQCQEAGIRVVMITGDYPATASAIAAQAGLAGEAVLSGDELSAMSEPKLRRRIRAVSVCARIAPAQKLRIVQALRENGEVVAMTGDGVNDAPALKAAHAGIAMGLRGTEVARESASLVLLDDNFDSIVQAVRHGRRIFNNMQKSMTYILSMHVPIAGMALLPVLLGWPVMLYPMHIVFLQLIIDPACSLVSENEPAGSNIMRQPPRAPETPLFGHRAITLALLQGVGALLVVLVTYGWATRVLPESEARALGFSTLVVANLMLIFSNRSRSRTLFASLREPNRVLWIVTGTSIGLLSLAVYTPFLQTVFRFTPLSARDAMVALAAGAGTLLWVEALKIARRRQDPRRKA